MLKKLEFGRVGVRLTPAFFAAAELKETMVFDIVKEGESYILSKKIDARAAFFFRNTSSLAVTVPTALLLKGLEVGKDYTWEGSGPFHLRSYSNDYGSENHYKILCTKGSVGNYAICFSKYIADKEGLEEGRQGLWQDNFVLEVLDKNHSIASVRRKRNGKVNATYLDLPPLVAASLGQGRVSLKMSESKNLVLSKVATT